MIKYRFKKNIICSNCGIHGHEFKSCIHPITSYGIINIDIIDMKNDKLYIKEKFSGINDSYCKITSKKYPEIECILFNSLKLDNEINNSYKLDNETIPYKNEDDLKRFWFYKDKILFMMVSRKYSLGFIEFIRGKYYIQDSNTIINLFQQMYTEEIIFIKENSYDDILYYFINRNNESKEVSLKRIFSGKYSNEYNESKEKFTKLSEMENDLEKKIFNLSYYIENIPPLFSNYEWGFPKGRRDRNNEENMQCACREFEEETGYNSSEYCVLNKINAINEKLIGTNGISYEHVYYLAINNAEINKSKINYDKYEIGEIKWFTYDDAMKHIRPHHNSKKKILTDIYLFLINYLIYNN